MHWNGQMEEEFMKSWAKFSYQSILPEFHPWMHQKYSKTGKISGAPRNQSRSATPIFYQKMWCIFQHLQHIRERKNWCIALEWPNVLNNFDGDKIYRLFVKYQKNGWPFLNKNFRSKYFFLISQNNTKCHPLIYTIISATIGQI